MLLLRCLNAVIPLLDMVVDGVAVALGVVFPLTLPSSWFTFIVLFLVRYQGFLFLSERRGQQAVPSFSRIYGSSLCCSSLFSSFLSQFSTSPLRPSRSAGLTFLGRSNGKLHFSLRVQTWWSVYVSDAKSRQGSSLPLLLLPRRRSWAYGVQPQNFSSVVWALPSTEHPQSESIAWAESELASTIMFPGRTSKW
jgi:hypothetical protein